jgi:ribosomal protein L35AE/L33A
MIDEDMEYIYEENLRKGKIKLLCAKCMTNTNHTIIKSSTLKWQVRKAQIDGHTDYCIVRCDGCESQQLCTAAYNSEDMLTLNARPNDEVLEIPNETILQYPTVNTRYTKPSLYMAMPREVRIVYEETFAALCEGLIKLASIGMRLNVELVCLSHKTSGKTLYEKIHKLHGNQIIGEQLRDLLLSVKQFGNEGAHTTITPDEKQLQAAWDAVNILMAYLYGTKDVNNFYKVTRAIKSGKLGSRDKKVRSRSNLDESP